MDAQGAAVRVLSDPAAAKSEVQKGGPECSSDVRPALAPVDAREGEAATPGPRRVDVDPDRREGLRSGLAQIVSAVVLPRRGQPGQTHEAIVEGHGQGPGHVVVARACGSQAV